MASELVDKVPDISDDLLYVKKGDVYRGYRRDYLAQNLSKMEEGFVVCKKCDGIMKQASLCNEETTCSVCTEVPVSSRVKAVQGSIEVLEIKCPLLRDCDWKGKLSEAETHPKDCLYFLVQCEKCKQVFPRGERDDHENNSCPHRIVICRCCNKSGQAQDRDKHMKLCKYYPITCPNECGANFPRCKLSEHRSECELEEIECPYTEYGCKAKSMLRRDLLAHKKENIIEHTDLSLEEIQQLRGENTCLKKTVKIMKWKMKAMKELDGVEWKIDNIEKIAAHTTIEGPTFYVSNYRLKLCITTISIGTLCRQFYFYLARIGGEFDKFLGQAYITHYRVIEICARDYTESDYSEGNMEYELKVGSKSEWIYFISFGYETGILSYRFYFDVNTEPLASLEKQYSQYTSYDSGSDEDGIERDPFEC